MKPWHTLEEASAPDGTPLLLQRRGDEYVIRAAGHVLMTSSSHASEKAMAEVALENVRGAAPAVLVGGLGMGFTLEALLGRLPREARVTVAELSAAVVAWNLGPLALLTRGSVEDPRVEVVVADVGEVLRAATARFDAVLLDVDNGPQALTRDANSALYSASGLRRLRGALRPGGRAVVWSAGPDQAFERLLSRSGFDVSVRPTRARGTRGARHALFVGDVPGKRAGR